VSEIIFGHPYSGALLAFFSDELGGSRSHTHSSNSYYRTLYGKNYEDYVELALTFILLYDTVWITPADNHMPTSKLAPNRNDFIEELGLHADWEDLRGDSVERKKHIDRYLADVELGRILTNLKVPRHAWPQIVDSAVYEADLSARRRCPILCSVGRKVLIQRLVEIDAPAMHPAFSQINETQFVDFYRQDAGLAFRPKSLDMLMEVKQDAAVRNYGSQFIAIATALPVDEAVSRRRVRELVREAIEKERVASLFSGTLRWAGRALSFMHSPLAVAAGAGSYIASRCESAASWYEFAGSIHRATSLAAFKKGLDDE
jgi:hypothetical protein